MTKKKQKPGASKKIENLDQSEIVEEKFQETADSALLEKGTALASDKKTSKSGTRKEKKLAKKTAHKAKPLRTRALIKAAKITFIYIPILIIISLGALLFFSWFYLTPPVVEKIAKNSFGSVSHGTLDLKVEKFNLYSGFVINNIVVRSGEDFARAKVFEMEKAVFDYSFFRIFTGSIRIPEVGLYSPRVYLKEQKGVWNVASLMKESKKDPAEKDEPDSKEEAKSSSDKKPGGDINLPIAVDLLFKFILKDLNVFVKSESFTAEMKGLSFNAGVEIPPFKTIPLSVEAVRLLKTMKFELNPQNTMTLTYNSGGVSTNPDLTLMWKLVFQNTESKEFYSQMKIGSSGMPVRLQNKHLAPLNFMVSYDMIYNPGSDILSINDFSITFKDSCWLKLAGNVKSVTENQFLNITMKESLIPLADLYPYYVTLTEDRTIRFGGNVSLYPLDVTGIVTSPNVKGAIAMRNLSFRNPKLEMSIPVVNLNYSASTAGTSMGIGTELKIPQISYTVQGSRSGNNGLILKSDITALDNFDRVIVNSLVFDVYNPEGHKSALYMDMKGDVSLADDIKGTVDITKLRLVTAPLSEMLPGRFRKIMASIPLKQQVDLKIKSNFSLGQNITDADLTLLGQVPDFDINDLKLEAAVSQNNKAQRVDIKKFALGSASMNLALKASGMVELKKSPISNSDIKVSLELNNPVMQSVAGPWMTSGKVRLEAFMKGDLEKGKASGNMIFDKFNLKNDEEKLSVESMNMNFPFEYAFTPAKGEKSSISITQDLVLDTSRFKPEPNFTIKSVKAKHPVRDISYEYMKDLTSHIIFKNNVFSLTDLRAGVMGGSLYGRSVIFNLADFNTENMEFNLVVDGNNIDIGRLDNPDPAAKSSEAELSFNANFSGKGLNIEKELTATGSISIYKIGQDFANRLMKGLSEEQGKSKLGAPVQWLVDNALGIKGFDFRLDRGLVYATVTFQRRGLSILGTVDKSRVDFERIPIQEYLRKVAEVK